MFNEADIKRIHDEITKVLSVGDADFDTMEKTQSRENERKKGKMKNLFSPAGAKISWENGNEAIPSGGVGSERDMMFIMDAIHELKQRFDGTEALVRSIRQDVDGMKVNAEMLQEVAAEMTKNSEQSVLMARTVLAGIDQDTYKMLKSLGDAIEKGDVDKLTDVAKQAKAKVKQYEATGIISAKSKEIKVVVPKIEKHTSPIRYSEYSEVRGGPGCYEVHYGI